VAAVAAAVGVVAAVAAAVKVVAGAVDGVVAVGSATRAEEEDDKPKLSATK